MARKTRDELLGDFQHRLDLGGGGGGGGGGGAAGGATRRATTGRGVA